VRPGLRPAVEIVTKVWAVPLVRPVAHDPAGRAQTKGAAQFEVFSNGEAQPRLTSGGEAGVEGVKFQDRA